METITVTKVVKKTEKQRTNLTFLGMRTIQQIIRNDVKAMIIANNGTVKNYDLTRLYDKYRNEVHIVTLVQNALSYFRFSPQQAYFRAKYNFNA
jgi:DUF1009 family protein